MRLFKVVDTEKGLTIAQLKHVGELIVSPDGRNTQIRVDKVLTEYIENNLSSGWGPVDRRTVYAVGRVTEADDVDTDVSNVSGSGLHAFTERAAAQSWMDGFNF